MMCLDDESFLSFVGLLSDRVIEWLQDGLIILGEARVLWVWSEESAVWCLQGVVA